MNWSSHFQGVSTEIPRLPSGDAALRLVASPDAESALEVARTLFLRSGWAAIGLYFAGIRSWQLLKLSLAAAAAIEVGVLVWAKNATVAKTLRSPAPKELAP